MPNTAPNASSSSNLVDAHHEDIPAVTRPWMHSPSIRLWGGQLLAMFLLVCCAAAYFYWNFNIRDPEYRVCVAEPYPEHLRMYLLPIVGAALSQNVSQLVRILLMWVGCSMENKVRHPMATTMNISIHLIVSVANLCIYLNVTNSTCLDYFGVRSSPFLWIEWCCTVPFMFFLISFLDVKKKAMQLSDLLCQMLAGSSLVMLYLANERLPVSVIIVLFVGANIFMTWALLWLLYDAYNEYSAAYKVMVKVPREDWESIMFKDLYDQLVVAQWKLNSSAFINIFFLAFPALYYLYLLKKIDYEVFILSIHCSSVVTKVLLYNILCDGHLEVIDVNKMLLIEEKKKSASSKHAFLRYVFHEVRVPLNSITLGTELLSENQQLGEEESDTLQMMKDACVFMTETLNDVLSLQKIEEGKLQLEERFFPPQAILKSMMSNLRSQYENKRLTLYINVHSRVPLNIFGDQFRLEHVLGNLLSNAIKFSDEDTRIWISVYKSGGYVYFSVKDEGPGMKESERKCLFSPFVQIRAGELQKGRGSGLGLSICKTIISLSDGIIGSRSTPRVGDDISTGGSEFFFGVKDVVALDTITSDGNNESALMPLPTSITAGSSAASVFAVDSVTAAGSSSDTASVTERADSVEVLDNLSTPRTSIYQSIRIVVTPTAAQVRRSTAQFEAAAAAEISAAATSRDFRPSRILLTNQVSPARKKTASSLATPVEAPDSVGRNTRSRAAAAAAAAAAVAASSCNTDAAATSHAATTAAATSSSSSSAAPLAAVSSSAATTAVKSSSVDQNTCQGRQSSAEGAVGSYEHIQHILVVDDVLSNRKMLQMILRRKGFSCDQCENGQDAVDRVQEMGNDYYQIIFMDSVMPVMSGPLAAEAIRSHGYSNLLVAVTGNAMDTDVTHFERSGADIVLAKPLKFDQLEALLKYSVEHGVKSNPQSETMKSYIFSFKK